MMNRVSKIITFAAAIMLLFAACDVTTTQNNNGDNGPPQLTMTATSTGGVVYYSLATRSVVPNPATTDWDIGLSYAGTIVTNSGSTATDLSSGGTGGVWFANTNDFGTSIAATDATFNSALNTDAKVWYNSGAPGAVSAEVTVNELSWLGYGSGDGSSGNPYGTPQYNANAYYVYVGGGVINLSNQVYVVRHGNGTSHSKIQVIAREKVTSTTPATLNLTLYVVNLD